MKKIIILPLIMILLMGKTLAISMTRELPSEAGVGATFDLTHIVTGSAGNYGVLYIIDITGGCTIAGMTHIAGGFLGISDKTTTSNVIASSSAGTCTFTGNYQFADASGTYPEVDFPTQTVTISGDEICIPKTCSGLGYECGSHPDNCGGFVDCGVCANGEICTNGDCFAEGCSCTSWIDIGCVGTAMKQRRTCTPSGCDDEEQYISDITCEAAPPPTNGCAFYQTLKDGECKIATWVYLAVAGFIALMLLKKK